MSGAILYPLARPLLFSLDAERAHGLALAALRTAERVGTAWAWGQRILPDPRRVFGLTFPNPVGLAAGLDKNGDYIDALGRLGFGFIEIGTVTPRPQPGNLKPRLFRLPQARALINRMGFNNGGLEQLLANLASTRYKGILGVNIGKNADTLLENALEDYLVCLRAVYAHASYVTVNISSPNTRDLRKLQAAGELENLLRHLKLEQGRLADQHGRYVPLVVKIAPDLERAQVAEIGALLVRFEMDGVIATNTTVARGEVETLRHGREHGGLSGGPLLEPSNRVLEQLRQAVGPDFPIIGVGGILSGDDARRKVQAGADLVQIYTGLIYRGPALVAEAAQALRAG